MLESIDTKPLYENYGRTSDEEIRSLLERIKLVGLRPVKEQIIPEEGRLLGGIFTVGPKMLEKVKKDPRRFSYPVDWGQEPGEYISPNRLMGWKTVYFLCEAVYLFKPDIGEVIDQMTELDKLNTDAICIHGAHIPVPGVNEYGSYLAEATLLQFTPNKPEVSNNHVN